MELSEKTFELNVTHEILLQADYLWNLLLLAGSLPDALLATIRRSPYRLPARMRPPFATGLSLQQEAVDGWDVKIQFPPRWPGQARCLFLQFKLATSRQWSQDAASKFHGHRFRRRPHASFQINNNKALDQHVLMRNLAASRLTDSVNYALPRITSPGAFNRWAGRLLTQTSFLSVSDVDSLASKRGLTISSGTAHHVCISYDGIRRELRSEVVDLAEATDPAPSLVGEIFAIRAWRALTEFARHIAQQNASYPGLKVDLPHLFEAHLSAQAEYLAVPQWGLRLCAPELLDRTSRDDQGFQAREYDFLLEQHLREEDPNIPQSELDDAVQADERRRIGLFAAIVAALTPYRELVRGDDWIERVPEPRAIHTTAVSNDGLGYRFWYSGVGSDGSLEPGAVSGLSAQLI